MISLKIEEVKTFMAMLLTNSLFDEFVLKEMELQTFTSFHVYGQFHENFFSKEELEQRGTEKAVLWGEIREIAFSIIRGHKSPLMMKIVLQLPSSKVVKLLESLGGKLGAEDVGGMYINIRFEKNELHIVSATAIKTFTLDKTLDTEWDGWVMSFLSNKGIMYEKE